MTLFIEWYFTKGWRVIEAGFVRFGGVSTVKSLHNIVLALIISRLDHYKAILAGLPQTTIAPLQRVQNAAARLVFELGPREHVTPCLLQLHWLPVRWRIQFKLCCIMHSVFNGKCPAYLPDSECQQTASSPTIILIDRPRATMHNFAPSIATLKSRSRVSRGHWKRFYSIDSVWFPVSVL